MRFTDATRSRDETRVTRRSPPTAVTEAELPAGLERDAITVTRATAPVSPAGASPETTVLGRYALTRRLGSGAFGTVWAARDERLERDVAVKVLPRERVIPARFEREARAAARLQHPSIVTLYEAAVDDDGAYLVCELVRGRALDALLAAGRLSDQDVVTVALALTEALEHAHGEGVIHRDVKPANVLVARRRSGPPEAKLTDFGVAHVVGGDSLTRTGDVIGTAAYMAPEQAAGRACSPASDLYSLALLVYEALTGVNPVAEAVARGQARRLGTYLPPIRRQRRDLPRELAAAVDQALRPRPSERGTVRQLGEALAASRADLGDAAGVVAPARTLTLLGTRLPAPEAPGFGPEWSSPAPGDDAGPKAIATPTRSRVGLRAALILTALLSLTLGASGLAGATPGVVGALTRRAGTRAALAALAFLWLGAAGRLTGQPLYWSLIGCPPERVAIGAAAWGAAALTLPWLWRLGPLTRVAALAAWAAALPLGLAAAGLRPLTGAALGALLAGLLGALPPVVVAVRARRLP